MTAPTKFTGLLLASGVNQADPLAAVLEVLAPFSLTVLSADNVVVRDRFIYTLLVELSPDHVAPLSADLDQISAAGVIDIAYDFTAFALPPSADLEPYHSTTVAASLSPAQILELHKVIASGAQVTAQKVVMDGSFTVLHLDFLVGASGANALCEEIRAMSRSLGLATAVNSKREARIGGEAILFDMDSTFINQEVIDEVAALAGVGEEVSAITDRAMKGELDFKASLIERVRLLKGQPADLLQRVQEKITLTSGAREFVAAAHAHGARVGIVSGGFHDVIDEILAPLGLDLIVANRFEIVDGILTGEVLGEIVDREVKARTLASFGDGASRRVAVGDGANDTAMIQGADLGVAFCAKPALQEVAGVVLNHRDLRALLPLLSY
jgi:phosphoserine phosphatase